MKGGNSVLYARNDEAYDNSALISTTTYEDDIVLTIYGPKLGEEGLALESYSPDFSSLLPQMDVLSLSFNKEVSVSADAKAYIYEGEEEVAQSVSMAVNQENPSVVDIDFGSAPLYFSHNYSVVVPEGSIVSASDGAAYKRISLDGYQGATYHHIGLASASPADGSEISYLADVNMNFSFPQGYNLGLASTDAKAYLYKDGTDEPIGEYTAEYNTAATGYVVTINKFDLSPASTYRLMLPEGQVKPCPSGSMSSSDYLKDTTNPEIVLTYTTPAVIEPLPLTNGLTCSLGEGNTLTVTMSGYLFENKLQSVYTVEGAEGVTSKTETVSGPNFSYELVRWYVACPLYDVTGGTEKLVEVVDMLFTPSATSEHETMLVGTPSQTLYAGRTYRLVVPAGTLAPKVPGTVVANAETAFEVEGTVSPLGIAISGSSIAADAEVQSVGLVAFYSGEGAAAADGAVMKLTKGGDVVKEAAVTVADFGGNTVVAADFGDSDTHAPYAIEAGADDYAVVLPEGSVVGADGVLTNAEQTVAFKGLAVAPETEYVTVSLTVGDMASTSQQAEKGKAYAVALTPEENWQVAALTLNGEDVTEAVAADGTFTIGELTADAALAVTLEYTGLTYTETSESGIIAVPESRLRAWSENGSIVIEGLTAGDNVAVYGIGGGRLAQFTATNSRADISVPTGAAYIVRINNVAVKLVNK